MRGSAVRWPRLEQRPDHWRVKPARGPIPDPPNFLAAHLAPPPPQRAINPCTRHEAYRRNEPPSPYLAHPVGTISLAARLLLKIRAAGPHAAEVGVFLEVPVTAQAPERVGSNGWGSRHRPESTCRPASEGYPFDQARVRVSFGPRVVAQDEGETRLQRLDLGSLDLPLQVADRIVQRCGACMVRRRDILRRS